MYTPLNLKDRVPTNPGRVTLTPVAGQPNTYDMVLADSPTQAGSKVNAAVFAALDAELTVIDMLRADTIQGCTATPTLSGNQVTQILHKDGSGNTVRTDTFSYATNLITEVRTLASGGTITYKYHLDTLVTEVA